MRRMLTVWRACRSCDRTPERGILNSGKVLPAGLPFRQAVGVGDVVYLSGQAGIAAARD
jgi:enamine deaminase RidA (YjgF/YER057c/UK114 family)